MEVFQVEINNKSKLIINQATKELAESMEEMRKTSLAPMQELAKNMEIIRKTSLAPMQELAQSMEMMRKTSLASMQELAKSMEVMRKTSLAPRQELVKSMEIARNTYSLPIKELTLAGEIWKETLNEIPKFLTLYNESIASYKDLADDDYLQPVNCEEVVQYVNEVGDILQDNSLSVIERIYKILVQIYSAYENIEKYFTTHPVILVIITSLIFPIISSK